MNPQTPKNVVMAVVLLIGLVTIAVSDREVSGGA